MSWCFMTRRELWEMIGRGELRREREGGGEDGKQHMKHMVFLSTAAFKGIFVLKRSFKKKKKEWSSTEQASNEAVAKNSGGTFYQIQPDIYICFKSYFTVLV